MAGLARRWRLLGASILVVMCQLIWVAPVVKPWNTAPSPESAGRLRLFDANVSQANENLTEIAREIHGARPQIVTLEELTPQAYSSLRSTGVLGQFPYSLVRVEAGASGMGLWSTLPLSSTETWDSGGGQIELDATAMFGARKIRIAVAHVYAPVGQGQPALWRTQLRDLAKNLNSQPRPLLVAGDFNSTADLPEFRHILGDGLSDAAVLAGKGWEMTWPRNQAWVLPYLRIDHVLLSKQLTVTSYKLGTGEGSDHKPLIVGIAFAQ